MELPGFGMLQALPPRCYPGAKPSQELQQLQNCAGLSWSLPGSQRGERGGNGRREWEQPNVERTMGYKPNPAGTPCTARASLYLEGLRELLQFSSPEFC